MQIRKKGDEIKKKSSLLKLLSQSQPNFAEMIQNCVQRRPGWAITKNRNFFKCPKLLYFKAESAQI